MIGTPLVDNAMVLATAVKQGRGKKLVVFRYKSKKRFRYRRGHRQELTVLTIDDIVVDGISLIIGNASVAKETSAEEEGVVTEVVEVEASVSEATEIYTEQSTSRRCRMVKAEDAEDTESNT